MKNYTIIKTNQAAYKIFLLHFMFKPQVALLHLEYSQSNPQP